MNRHSFTSEEVAAGQARLSKVLLPEAGVPTSLGSGQASANAKLASLLHALRMGRDSVCGVIYCQHHN
eukprot:2309550-Amphidinium_carterae.1